MLAQVVVSEAGAGKPSRAASSSISGGGSPVLLATIATLSSSSASLSDDGSSAVPKSTRGVVGGGRSGTASSRRNKGPVSVVAVVLTAFDRKLYLAPGYLPSTSVVSVEEAVPLSVCKCSAYCLHTLAP